MVPAAYFGEAPQSGDQLADFSRIVHTYHYGRDVVSQSKMGTTGFRAYRDEPNVTAFVMAKTAPTAEAVTETATFDILHRSSAVSPLAGGSGPGGAHPLLAEGVLAHVIERAMVEVGAVMPAELALPAGSSTGVGRVFEEAARQGIATVVLRPGEADPTRLAIGEGARARITAALTAGLVVVVPERPVALGGEERVGWWLVDPATGATAGPDGRRAGHRDGRVFANHPHLGLRALLDASGCRSVHGVFCGSGGGSGADGERGGGLSVCTSSGWCRTDGRRRLRPSDDGIAGYQERLERRPGMNARFR